MVEKNTERLWEQLLDFIDDGRVIPVIGPELLMLELDSKTTLLYDYLAEQLANRLQIGSHPADTLNSVACRYLAQGGQWEDIYRELKVAMPPMPQITLPETLVKLAEIRPFKLFVTTSFAPLLAMALNQVRYRGLDKTQVLAFAPGSTNDLPSALEQLDRTTVFHLFGKLTTAPEYAVTDEDVLEFMYALQSRTSRPARLFDALNGQNLMVVGCPLSDWQGRFFVRIVKKERLLNSIGKTDFLAGDQLKNETNLEDFLRYFSSRTKVFPLASTEFVNELHRRWKVLHPSDQKQEEHGNLIGSDNDADKMQSGVVFLSYASEDRPAVQLIRDALEQAGIDVWFDRNPEDLRIGENFENKIKAMIDRCSLFIPIISQNTLTPDRRFFRKEWNYAKQLTDSSLPFMQSIIPVVIDDTPPGDLGVPDHIRNLHWEKMPKGQASDEFVAEIKRLYREYQKNRGQPA